MLEKENSSYQHFLFFPKCFPKPSSLVSLKVGIVSYIVIINSVSNNKIYGLSHLKAFTDKNINFSWKGQKTLMEKGEKNAVSQHFLLFLQCVQKLFFFQGQ